MSLDLEDRLEQGLDDLARQAPVPDDWPELGARIIPLDPRPPRRHRLVTGLVAAAATIVVIAAISFVVARDDGNPPTSVATNPPSTGATAGSPALGGHWSATGPRLTDEQLAWLVEPVTLDDGATVVVPRSGPGDDGMASDIGRRVVGVEVARTTPVAFSLLAAPEGPGYLSANQHMMILQYLASLPPETTRHATGPLVTMVVVRTDPAPRAADSGSACGDPEAAEYPDCTEGEVDYLWFFVAGATMPTTRVAVNALPRLDVLAGLEPIGTWTPGIAAAATPETGPSTSAPSPQSPPTSVAARATATTVPTVPPSTSPPSSAVPSRPGTSSAVPPSSTGGADPAHGHP
ncbi:MAG TPA: hypothetical protein VFN21_03100 [Acidimicrobiales bacterium]|nr:hypothetical protein [Acidimicrobiales bacterium]